MLSNASILKYNLNTGKLSTYATGIRNVEGIATNSMGELTAIVGGMNEEGGREVKDDVDYIYDIKEKAWYGWPDFSGGDLLLLQDFLMELINYHILLKIIQQRHHCHLDINIIVYNP